MAKLKRNLTTNAVAQRTGAPATTVVAWANRGLIRCERDSTGRRLFDASVIDVVKALHATRGRTAQV